MGQHNCTIFYITGESGGVSRKKASSTAFFFFSHFQIQWSVSFSFNHTALSVVLHTWKDSIATDLLMAEGSIEHKHQ